MYLLPFVAVFWHVFTSFKWELVVKIRRMCSPLFLKNISAPQLRPRRTSGPEPRAPAERGSPTSGSLSCRTVCCPGSSRWQWAAAGTLHTAGSSGANTRRWLASESGQRWCASSPHTRPEEESHTLRNNRKKTTSTCRPRFIFRRLVPLLSYMFISTNLANNENRSDTPSFIYGAILQSLRWRSMLQMKRKRVVRHGYLFFIYI